jgi:hypothetical protein
LLENQHLPKLVANLAGLYPSTPLIFIITFLKSGATRYTLYKIPVYVPDPIDTPHVVDFRKPTQIPGLPRTAAQRKTSRISLQSHIFREIHHP